MRTFVSMLACLLAWSAFAAAPQTALPVPRSRAEADGQLTGLLNLQLEQSQVLQDQLRRNDQLWLDARCASPEIDALRQRYTKLQAEMTEIQATLRKLVLETEAGQAEAAKTDRLTAEAAERGRQIEELRKRRPSLP